MEKKKKFTTVCDARLAGFEGFYCSIWSPDDEVYNYSVENGMEEDEDFTVDYKGYQKAVCESSQEALQEAQERYQAEVERIDTSLFTGGANVFKLEGLWGIVYVGLALVIQCFPEGKFWQIAENITGKKKSEILAAEAAKIAEEKKRDEEYEAALQKARQEAEEKRKDFEVRRAAWKAENPAPFGFKKVQNYTFKPGDIELVYPNEVDEKLGFRYHYHVYYKSFGKLCFCLCDENGKRLARGSEVWKKTAKETYIKVA